MNENEFFAEVCRGLGWEPTPWRLAVFAEWHRHEGMPLETTWNPLATTRFSGNTPLNLDWNKGFGAGNWNSVPVRVYRDAQAGIRATVETLALGYYVYVRKCFADQVGYPEAVEEFATYVGSVAYGEQLVAFMNACTASKAPPSPSADGEGPGVRDPRVDQILAALTGLGPTAAMERVAAWNERDGEPTGNSLLDGYLAEQERVTGALDALAHLAKTRPAKATKEDAA